MTRALDLSVRRGASALVCWLCLGATQAGCSDDDAGGAVSGSASTGDAAADGHEGGLLSESGAPDGAEAGPTDGEGRSEGGVVDAPLCGERRVVACRLPDGATGTTRCRDGSGYSACGREACTTAAYGPFGVDSASCEVLGVDEGLRGSGVSEPSLDVMNLEITFEPAPGGGAPPERAWPYRVGAGECGGDYGWYVQAGAVPRVYLCPRSCAPTTAETTVEVSLGCDSTWRELPTR
ncbi:MAG: hypothetical protein FJ104_02470 [Deltaproteobacteria bacterium]|nr:hypothetical protein [Deltaproteobacteria bacterium]